MEKITPSSSTIISEPTIPIVDLSPFFMNRFGDESGRKKAKDDISKACTYSGVFQIENHFLSFDILDKLISLSNRFFTYSDKAKAKYTEKSKPGAGYIKKPIDKYNDYEYLLMFPPEIPFNGIPTHPPEYRETFEEVFKYFSKIAHILEEIINEGLGLPPNFLKEYNNDRSSDCLMVMNYPPAAETETGTETGNIGIAAHEDANIFTIVLEDNVEGLEVFINNRWVPVIPTPGNLVVIIGDVIQVLSNKEFKNVTHRAVRHRGKYRKAVDFCYCLQEDKWVEPIFNLKHQMVFNPLYRGFFYKEYLDLKLHDEKYLPPKPEYFFRITHYEIGNTK